MSFRSFIRRLLGTIPLILGISVVLFAVVHMAPGTPLDFYADNPNVTREALEQMRVAFGSTSQFQSNTSAGFLPFLAATGGSRSAPVSRYSK